MVKTDAKNCLIFATLASASLNIPFTYWSSRGPMSFFTVFLLLSYLENLFYPPLQGTFQFFCSSLIFLFTLDLPCFMGALFPHLGNLTMLEIIDFSLSQPAYCFCWAVHTLFWKGLLFFCTKMHAGGFRHAESRQDGQDISFLRKMLPSRGPTPSTFSCCILTEWCVTPPHTQCCSLTHWAMCRAAHSHSKLCQSCWDWCCPGKLSGRPAQLFKSFHLTPVKFQEFSKFFFPKICFCICFRYMYSKNNCKSYKPDHWKITETTGWVIALSLGPPSTICTRKMRSLVERKIGSPDVWMVSRFFFFSY